MISQENAPDERHGLRADRFATWQRLARACAIGCTFALSLFLLLSTLVFTPNFGAISGLEMRMHLGGWAAMAGGTIAFSAFVGGRRFQLLPAVFATALLIASGAIAASWKSQDLVGVNYRTRTHDSFAMEDIAGDSPTAGERTDIRTLFALKSRLAGAWLLIPTDFPILEWRMFARSEIIGIERLAPDKLPAPLSIAQIADWRAKGALELSLSSGATLVLPPELAPRKQAGEGRKFAIVRESDDAPYVLIPVGESRAE